MKHDNHDSLRHDMTHVGPHDVFDDLLGQSLGQVLVQAGAQCLVDVGVVRLGDQADVICSSVHQGLHLRVGCSFAAHLAGGAEGDQPGVGQTQFISSAREELGVGRVGAGCGPGRDMADRAAAPPAVVGW